MLDIITMLCLAIGPTFLTKSTPVEAAVVHPRHTGGILAKGMTKKQVKDTLGPPAEVQSVWSQTAWVYSNKELCIQYTCRVYFDNESNKVSGLHGIRAESLEFE